MKDIKINRRNFLHLSALAALGMTVKSEAQEKHKEKKDETDPVKILNYKPEMRYRQFGKTDIYFSALSLGGSGLERSIAHYAIDHGINLVHMSSTYKGGNSIIELGSVLKEKRDKVYIALKDNFYKGSIDDINEPLRILNTDYVDFLMFNRHKESEVIDEKIVELFEEWKKQGKVRFAGLTTHEDVKNCVSAGIKSGFYSLIQPAINQPGYELLQEDFKQAQEKGIGIMAMKTIKGIKEQDLQLAQLKKVLLNPAISTISKGFKNFEMFDDYLKATQETLSSKEDVRLYRYAQKNRQDNCMMCGECKQVCPQHIEIPTILRCADYYHGQLDDWHKAITTYQSIPVTNRFRLNCTQCDNCEQACPNGIPITKQLTVATELFEAVHV